MATFKQIRGQTIKKYTTNPTNPLLGQMWYNNTTGSLKVYTNIGGAWAAGGALNVGLNAIRAAGSQTAALAVGGDGAPGPLGTTQIYNGASWTTSPVSISPRGAGGMSTAGTTTAAWYSGGSNPGGRSNATEEFDGSAWTTGGVYPLSINMGGTGTLTAGLGFGGYQPATPVLHRKTTNEYNGTSWSPTGDLNTGRSETCGCGTQTATISAGGTTSTAGSNNFSEEYNGATWTNTNNLNTVNASGAMFGTTASAQLCGGYVAPAAIDVVQSWDGTSWAANPASLASAVQTNGAAGTSGVSGLSTGGSPFVTATEEYTDPTFGTQTVTAS